MHRLIPLLLSTSESPGWVLYVLNGRLAYSYNWFSSEVYTVTAPDPLPIGEVEVQYQFDFDGGHPGAGGTGTLLVNGEVVVDGRIEKIVPLVFSGDETMDIGRDTASPVVDDYGEGSENVFTGKIAWVQIDIEDDEVSHTEDPEQTYRRIMARQ